MSLGKMYVEIGLVRIGVTPQLVVPDSPARSHRVSALGKKTASKGTILRKFTASSGAPVLLDQHEIKEIKQSLSTLSPKVRCFVAPHEVPLELCGKSYYLLPDEVSKLPYALIRNAMELENVVAVLQYVSGEHQHLGVIQTFGKLLMLRQVHYARRATPEVVFPQGQLDQDHVSAAFDLVRSMTKPFKLKNYEDQFSKEWQKVIDARVTGKKLPKNRASSASVTNLMAALKASIKQAARSNGRSHEKPPPKFAPSKFQRRSNSKKVRSRA